MREIPRPYEIYRHFKGKCYQVLSIATHSETGEQMVVYQQLYSPYGVYVRPLEMFLSKVDKVKYPDVQQEYRFEKLQSAAWEKSEENRSESRAYSEPAVEVKPESVTHSEPVVEVKPEPVIHSRPAVEAKTELKGESQSVLEASEEEFQLDEGLLAFLEADSYEKKLEILSQIHATITDSMIDTMAVSLDIEVKDGDIEQRYSEILNCLLTMERFECNRLR